MHDYLLDLAIVATVAVSVAIVVRRMGWNMAIPLIATGAFLSAIPVGPDAPSDPEFILMVILAPLVFGEALGSSYLDLRKVSRPVLALSVGLVVATTFVIGVMSSAIVAIPLAMAFALGAVLAPTDAVAVSAVARRAGLPRRLVSILEGESLVNDGTGLTALRVALAAAAAGSVTLLQVSGVFAIAVLSGVLVGAVGGWTITRVLRWSNDVIASNALMLVAPFLLYPLAELLQGSGILAVVVAGLVIAHVQHSDPGYSERLQGAVVWRHITFLLQALAFFMIGMELPDVAMRLHPGQWRAVLILIPSLLLALIVTRAVFVFAMTSLGRARAGNHGRFPLAGTVILSWAAARGPVSGLAAFSIPITFDDGTLVPYRDVILATTFGLIVITLLLSLTLAPLSRWLHLHSDDDGKMLRRIDAELARAALDRLSAIESEAEADGNPLPPEVSERLREDAERRILESTKRRDVTATEELVTSRMLAAAREMVRAEQEQLIRMRDEEGLPDSLVRPVMSGLDVRDQSLQPRGRSD
ncbi:MAG: hypothetical protein GC156_12455 [Actinomycetales bacterium]|nr:hypothetical protein [Actinomycetales bacterium]